MKKIYLSLVFWAAIFYVNAQQVATFEDVELGSDSYWNGADGSGGINSGDFYFYNDYNTEWSSWSGFAVSNMKDIANGGYENQYSAIAGAGANESKNYAVAYFYGKTGISFENPLQLSGFYITNSTYAYLSMKDGDAVSKKFGGNDGTDADYFKLLISGTDIYGEATGTVEFYLADFRSDNSEEDYIVNSWKWVDLSPLGVVDSLYFWFESSDVGDYGINTPTYFCLDDFNGTSPEDADILTEAGFEDVGLPVDSYYNGSDGTGSFSSGGFVFNNTYDGYWSGGFAASTTTDTQTEGYTNMYSAITGTGTRASSAYAVSYGSSEIDFEKTTVSGFYITNSTYAYYSMLNGDSFAKRFGGEDGTDEDWFKLTVYGVDEADDTTGTVEYYLADFRSENSNEDYIVKDWKWLDLTSLGEITKLRFSLSSSDVGDYGMNTPAYFCLDQLNHQDIAPQIKYPIATVNEETYPDNDYTVSLDSVFTDEDNDDAEIVISLVNIDNANLVTGSIDAESSELALQIADSATGTAKITLSATSNGKTIYHSFNMIISVPVSSPLIANENEFKVYPNPVQSEFYVDLPQNTEQIMMFSTAGNIIYNKMLAGETTLRISDLQNSSAGVYFLKIKTGDSFLTKKIVKW